MEFREGGMSGRAEKGPGASDHPGQGREATVPPQGRCRSSEHMVIK